MMTASLLAIFEVEFRIELRATPIKCAFYFYFFSGLAGFCPAFITRATFLSPSLLYSMETFIPFFRSVKDRVSLPLVIFVLLSMAKAKLFSSYFTLCFTSRVFAASSTFSIALLAFSNLGLSDAAGAGAGAGFSVGFGCARAPKIKATNVRRVTNKISFFHFFSPPFYNKISAYLKLRNRSELHPSVFGATLLSPIVSYGFFVSIAFDDHSSTS